MSRVLALAEVRCADAARIAAAYGAELVMLPAGAPIPGSYWGAPEAGLVGTRIYARPDTPAHSFLHELCHFVCMDGTRRANLATDAGGDDEEECAVCYLQILLAAELAGFGRARALADMDAWGYSFREGSAQAWLEGDARDARAWLVARELIDAHGRPTWSVRGAER